MSRYLPYPRWADRLPRAIQRVGCEHPAPLDGRQMNDLTDRYLCQSCGAEWMEAAEEGRW